jgi:hypothetical protein
MVETGTASDSTVCGGWSVALLDSTEPTPAVSFLDFVTWTGSIDTYLQGYVIIHEPTELVDHVGTWTAEIVFTMDDYPSRTAGFTYELTVDPAPCSISSTSYPFIDGGTIYF